MKRKKKLKTAEVASLIKRGTQTTRKKSTWAETRYGGSEGEPEIKKLLWGEPVHWQTTSPPEGGRRKRGQKVGSTKWNSQTGKKGETKLLYENHQRLTDRRHGNPSKRKQRTDPKQMAGESGRKTSTARHRRTMSNNEKFRRKGVPEHLNGGSENTGG